MNKHFTHAISKINTHKNKFHYKEEGIHKIKNEIICKPERFKKK